MLSYFNIRTKFNACDYYMKREEIILKKNREDAQMLIEIENDGRDGQNLNDLIALPDEGELKQRKNCVQKKFVIYN